MDVEGRKSSVYMMKFGAYIPLSGAPFPHDPSEFPKLKRWQLAAALEVVHGYVKEGKVLGPFPGSTRICPITGKPWFFIARLWFRNLRRGVSDGYSMPLITPGAQVLMIAYSFHYKTYQRQTVFVSMFTDSVYEPD